MQCFRRVLWGFVAASVFSLPVTAETVTLSEAYDRMKSGALEFGIIDAELLASAEAVIQAKGLRRPRISMTLSFESIQQQVISSDNTAYSKGNSTYPKRAASLNLTQPIFDAAKFRALPLARAEQKLAEGEAVVARNRVVRDMITAYIAVAQAQLSMDRAKAVSSARLSYEDVLQRQVDAGTRDMTDLIVAQGDTFAAQSEEAEAGISKMEALAELQRYVGPEVDGVALDGGRIGTLDMTRTDNSMSAERLLEVSPDMAVARGAIEVAKAQERVAKGARRPTLDLNISVDKTVTEGSLFGGGSDTQTTSGGLVFNVPLYEGGIKRSRQREATKRIEIAEMKLKQTEKALVARHKGLVEGLTQAAKRVGVISRQLATASEAALAAKTQLDLGKSTEQAVLEQELRSKVLRYELQSARLQQFRLQVELYALFGALDIGGIAEQSGG